MRRRAGAVIAAGKPGQVIGLSHHPAPPLATSLPTAFSSALPPLSFFPLGPGLFPLRPPAPAPLVSCSLPAASTRTCRPISTLAEEHALLARRRSSPPISRKWLVSEGDEVSRTADPVSLVP